MDLLASMCPFEDSEQLIEETPNSVDLNINSNNKSSGFAKEKLATFLRIRPLDNLTIDETPYKIISSNKIYIDEKILSTNNSLKNSNPSKKVYSFTEILDESATQINVFSKCCLPLVEDVLNGTNGFLFCYGTTSSGKSFTMRGPHEDPTIDPGLIPLSLQKIFSSRKFIDEPLIAKSKFCDITLVDQKVQDLEKQFKDSILASPCCRNVTSFDNYNNNIIFNEDGYQYICYLSYFEIYNEFIYDLLNSSSGGRGTALTLFADEKKRYYVKDLRSVMVSSLSEALKIYSFGWTNLQRNIQETGLNKNSSRSHSFLCITLIKFKEDEGKLLDYHVSHLTLGDLAGSERQNKTHSEGVRAKEGCNINVSLMHLKDCINQTKLNQKNPNRNFIVPFRNSNLTKFFQPYLTGNGKVWMIININPSPVLLKETCGSLDLGEAAANISTHSYYQLKLEESKRRMTQIWLQSSHRWSSFVTSKIPKVVIEENSGIDLKDGEDQPDFAAEMMEMEGRVRSEVISEFEELIAELTKEHEQDVQRIRDLYEKTMESKLEVSEKKYSSIINNLQAKIDQLTNELFDARESIVNLEEKMALQLEEAEKEAQSKLEAISKPIVLNIEQAVQTEYKYVPLNAYEELKESYENIIVEMKRESELNLQQIREDLTRPIIQQNDQEIQTEGEFVPLHEYEELKESYEKKIIQIQDENELNLRKVRDEITTKSLIITQQQECQTEDKFVPVNEYEELKETYEKKMIQIQTQADLNLEKVRQEFTKSIIITQNQECQTTELEPVVQVEEKINIELAEKELETKLENLREELKSSYEQKISNIQAQHEVSIKTLRQELTKPATVAKHQDCSTSDQVFPPDEPEETPISQPITLNTFTNVQKNSREITIDANYFPVSEAAKKKRKEDAAESPSTEVVNEYLKRFCSASTTKKSVKKSAKKPPKKSMPVVIQKSEDNVEEDELASLLLSKKKDRKKKSTEEESAIKIPTKRKKIPVTDAFLETTSPHFEDEQEQNIKGGRVLRPRRKIKF